MNESNVLVVGGGAMGSGIAFAAASAGYNIAVVEPERASRDRANARFAKDAQRAGDSSIAPRIDWYDSIPGEFDAAFAIEAVPERLDLKRNVFAALEAALPATAVLATNTSSLSVGDIVAALQHPERAAGLHFFNPPTVMALVEIVAGPETSDETLDRCGAFVRALNKTAVYARDTPGFIVNRIARPFYLQAMRALERDACSVPELDALARALGFRMGPFELIDLIGMDVNLATTESIYARTGEARLAPVRLQHELVESGKLGRKTGSGFYEYANGAPERPELAAVVPDERNGDERIVVVGFGGIAEEMTELLGQHYDCVDRVENDEMLDAIPADASIVIDAGTGTADRSGVLRTLDSMLGADTIVLCDAYATDVSAVAASCEHPARLVGYGVLGALGSQRAVEIADTSVLSDDALAVAEEVFAAMGLAVVIVRDLPALFAGRVVASVINEAVTAVYDEVATPDDVDTAMRLGTNYPIGPIAWGREIGGARVARILHRLAEAEGTMFEPHRSLWVLDVDDEPAPARSDPISDWTAAQ